MSLFPDLTVAVVISERYDDLQEIYNCYDAALRDRVRNLSYIFVVDGGFSEAADQLDDLAAIHPNIRVIRLNRPFGGSTTLQIALDEAQTEWILTLPPYLQIEPGSLGMLLDAAHDQDFIVARRWPIKGHAFNRASNALFNWIVRSMTGMPFRDLGCGVRLLRKSVAAEIPLYGGQHRFLPITAHQRGFRVTELNLPQAARDQKLKVHSPGKYTKRLIDLLTVFFLVKFTKRPLRFFGMIGSISIAAGGVVLATTVFQRLFMATPLADRPLLLIGLLLAVLGVQLFAVGLIGELVIFVHARELKEYTVLQQLNFGDEPGQDPSPDTVSGVTDDQQASTG